MELDYRHRQNKPMGYRERAPDPARRGLPTTSTSFPPPSRPSPPPGNARARTRTVSPRLPVDPRTVEIPVRPPRENDRGPHPASAARAGSRHRATGSTASPAGPLGLGRALLTAAAATVLPGAGHLLLKRRRAGALILAAFVLLAAAVALVPVMIGRSRLLAFALNTRLLLGVVVGCVVLGLGWITVIVRTYLLARPPRLGGGRRLLGAATVAVLCVTVAAPFGVVADLAASQRSVVNTLFPTTATDTAGGAAAALPARINVLLFGSDAGSDRAGTRSDAMMVASIDTTTSRAVLFGLPRNIEHAPFPPGSAMATAFPHGFTDPHDPLSGQYLLNAEYTYGVTHPDLAPTTPTTDPGLNLLLSSASTMLGIPIDFYAKINMSGFAAIIDAVGGVTLDVGPVPLPIGGVLPDGTHVTPDGYLPAGIQHLDGQQTLWYARSRRDSDDYNRMSRQRCLIHTVLQQKSPTDLLTHFQAVAAATTDSVATNIPQSFLPSLAALAGDGQTLRLDSITFDPSLPDPHQHDGKFDPSHPDFAYMRQLAAAATGAATRTSATPERITSTTPLRPPTTAPHHAAAASTPAPTAPVPLAESCTSPNP